MTPTNHTQRLIKLLGMTGSTHDGEALNAARLASQLIAQLGLTWEQVLNYRGQALERSVERAFEDGRKQGAKEARQEARQEAHQEAHREAFREGYLQGLQDAQNAPRPASWQRLVRTMLEEHADQLTKWEEGFLNSFRKRGWHTPTPRQRGVLEQIAGKCGVDVPEDGG